jgi:hypothetical protein
MENGMSSTNDLFTAMQIRNAIGQVADGMEVDPKLIPFVRAAVTGVCPTSDRGDQQFVVNVDTVDLFNVDTEELIWPRDPDEDIHEDVPLHILTQPDLWEHTRRQWDDAYPREWSAFTWRIAVPLANRLGFVGAWR